MNSGVTQSFIELYGLGLMSVNQVPETVMAVGQAVVGSVGGCLYANAGQ